MNEELELAIEQLRLRRRYEPWFIPVRLTPVDIPDIPVRAGETLRDLHWIGLFKDCESGIRTLVSLIAPSQKYLEGVWQDKYSASIYCIRLVAGRLWVTYCHGNNNRLDAHYYDCRLIGDVLEARWEWFHRPLAGTVRLVIVSPERLVGVWWSDNESRIELNAQSVSHGDVAGPLERRLDLTKVRGSPGFPVWSRDYFAKRERGTWPH